MVEIQNQSTQEEVEEKPAKKSVEDLEKIQIEPNSTEEYFFVDPN